LGHADGLGREGAVMHLGIVALLVVFSSVEFALHRSEDSVNDMILYIFIIKLDCVLILANITIGQNNIRVA
jgi:hypothetical protein